MQMIEIQDLLRQAEAQNSQLATGVAAADAELAAREVTVQEVRELLRLAQLSLEQATKELQEKDTKVGPLVLPTT